MVRHFIFFCLHEIAKRLLSLVLVQSWIMQEYLSDATALWVSKAYSICSFAACYKYFSHLFVDLYALGSLKTFHVFNVFSHLIECKSLKFLLYREVASIYYLFLILMDDRVSYSLQLPYKPVLKFIFLILIPFNHNKQENLVDTTLLWID